MNLSKSLQPEPQLQRDLNYFLKTPCRAEGKTCLPSSSGRPWRIQPDGCWRLFTALYYLSTALTANCFTATQTRFRIKNTARTTNNPSVNPMSMQNGIH